MDRVQNLTQAYAQAPWRKQMQILGLFLLILVFAALVAGIYLNVTARAAAIGREIQSMQSQIQDLQQENVDLQSQLAFITSAGVMENRARSLGFKPIENDQPIYILVPDYTERQAAVLAPPPGRVVASAPVLPAEFTESLFNWLHKQMLQSSFPFLRVKP